MKIVYKHQEGKGFVYGVPMRDLTAADVERVSPGLLKTAIDAGIFVAVTPEPVKKETPPYKKADKDGDA